MVIDTESTPQDAFPKADYPHMIYSSALSALYAGTGRLFRLVVRVVDLHPPTLIDGVPHTRVRFCDVDNTHEFDTLPLSEFALVSRAHKALQTGAFLEVFGMFVEGAGRRRGGKEAPAAIHVLELRDLSRPSALTGASDAEIEAVDRLIEHLRKTPGALCAFLLQLAHEALDAVTTSRSPRFRQCEKAVLLQALSHGQVRSTVNGRLSVLMCSRPGASKKIMALMAMMMAPISEMVQPALVSLSGLSARVEQGPSGWHASPGALARCNRGTVVIEDMHRIPAHHLRAIQGALTTVAEDGKVGPVKAATANYHAFTALHINTNFQSVLDASLRPPGARAKMIDLRMPFDLLSRIDLICYLDLGDNASKQARDIATQDIKEETPEQLEELEKKARLLKVMTSRLLDRFGRVDLAPVRESIGDLMDDISLLVGDFSAHMTEDQQQVFDGEGLLRRMANTLRKLVSASARLDGREAATEEDVQTAWEMLAFKLEVVRWICQDDAKRVRTIRSRQEVVAKARERAEGRWAEIMRRYAGQEVALVDMAEEMGYSPRTIGRDLEEHGVLPDLGWCQVPTLAEEAERTARVARGEKSPAPERQTTEEDYLEPEDCVLPGEEEVEVDRPAGTKLQPLGAEYDPVIEALNQLEHRQAYTVTETLVEAAVKYNPEPWETPFKVEDLERVIVPKLPWSMAEDAKRVVKEMVAVMKGPDRVAGGLLAMRLYLDADLLPSSKPFADAVEQGVLPEALREGAQEVLEIQKWRRERSQAP